MSDFNSLSQRVHEVQSRFHAKREQEREQKEQLQSLVEAIERDAEQFNVERTELRGEIAALRSRVAELEEQNQQLQDMLGGLLTALEVGDEDDIGRALEELEQRVAVIAAQRDAEPSAAPALRQTESAAGSAEESLLSADDELDFEIHDETEMTGRSEADAPPSMDSVPEPDEAAALEIDLDDEPMDEAEIDEAEMDESSVDEFVLDEAVDEEPHAGDDARIGDEASDEEFLLEEEAAPDEAFEVETVEETAQRPQPEPADEDQGDSLGLQDAQSLIKALARIDAGLEERLGAGGDGRASESGYAAKVSAAKRKSELEGEELAEAAATGVRDILRRVQQRSQEVLNAEEAMAAEDDSLVTDILVLDEEHEIQETKKGPRRRAAS